MVLGLVVGACNTADPVEDVPLEYLEEDVPLEYLETVIPPCQAVPGSSQDPCRPGRIPNLGSSAASVVHREIPNYWDLYPDWQDLFTPHLVIRATFLPNTTRCGLYERHFPAFADFSLPSEHRAVLCFTDARVNDYLIGTGPSKLTMESHGEPILYGPGDSLDWMEDLGTEVAIAFEGKEKVMFLAPSSTTAVEAWSVIEYWDVQRANDIVTVVAPFKEALERDGVIDPTGPEDYTRRDLTPEELALLEVPLDRFEKVIAAAAVRRAEATEGRIGVGDDLPMLITDANLLRPYYEGPGVGIVYETDAPAKPPPVPGGDDPEHPPGKVDDEEDNPDTTDPVVPMPDDEGPDQPKDTDTTTTTLPEPTTTTTTTSPDNPDSGIGDGLVDGGMAGLPTSLASGITFGALNDGYIGSSEEYQTRPVALSAGGFHTCGLLADQSIVCWGAEGDRDYGQADPPAGRFISVAAGDVHSCAIRADYTIVCWGAEVEDEFYNQGQADPPAGRFIAVAAGGRHNCTIRPDQSIVCWGAEGDRDYGQADPPAGRFISVAAGGVHSCAIRADYTIVCWGAEGRYDFGQTDPPAGRFIAVAAGEVHSCAIRSNQTVACWGINDPPVGLPDFPTDPPTGQVTAVASGWAHSCAILSDQTITCWGVLDVRPYLYFDHGYLYPPTGKFTTIAAGRVHACAIRTAGTVTCWGDNSQGQTNLPTGTSTITNN